MEDTREKAYITKIIKVYTRDTRISRNIQTRFEKASAEEAEKEKRWGFVSGNLKTLVFLTMFSEHHNVELSFCHGHGLAKSC